MWGDALDWPGQVAAMLGLLFVVVVAARDSAAAPMPAWLALVAAACCALIIWAMDNGTAIPGWGWAGAVLLSLMLLAWGAYDLRASLFGPGDGEVADAPPGRSLAGAMLSAATMELLFRGWLLGSMVDLFRGEGGSAVALFAANLAYALIHARQGVTVALSAGFFGVILSMTVLLSGSVWPAVVTSLLWTAMIVRANGRGRVAA